MKIPKKINIGGHVWAIKVVSEFGLDPGHIGECVFDQKEIRILNELKGEMLLRVLLHEIRHAHHFETGLSQVLHHQTMEMDCDSFASLLTSMFHLKFKQAR